MGEVAHCYRHAPSTPLGMFLNIFNLLLSWGEVVSVFCVPVGLCAAVVLGIFVPVIGVIREGVVGGVGGCGVGGCWLVGGECFGSAGCGGVLLHCLEGLPVRVGVEFFEF